MELLQGLLNRVSIQRLESPPPTETQVEVMLQAALRAPDHGNLKPWRSVMVTGEGLTKLGELLQKAQLERDPDSDPQTLERCIKMPHRAPSILVLIASPKEHPKVPEAEQIPPDGTRYELTGPKSAPVVILIHGLGLNKDCWQWLTPDLVNSYRILSYDLYGHALSNT